MKPIGKLRRLELREIWPNEAADFTPWLAQNLDALGEAVGKDLVLVQQEAAVGPYSLDLLLKDVGSDHIVVVENQLERTDHDHLGKLLTYAAGHDSTVAIWIAKEFTEQHRQVIDWLNARTNAESEFFGIVLEALQIDDSPAAPNLRLIAFPNNFQKAATAGASGANSPRMLAYQAFFQKLVDRMRERHHFTNARIASADGWFAFPTGFSEIVYAVVFSRGRRIRAEVYLDNPNSQTWNKTVFDAIEAESEEINREMGDLVFWQRLDDRRASRIYVDRPGNVFDDPDREDELLDWSESSLLKLKAVFGPRLVRVVSDLRSHQYPAGL